MVGADPFVGRGEQLAAVAAAARAAREGRAGVVLVSGEAGIGKTRLLHQATAPDPVPTVWATCWDGDGAPAFWPWIQVIRGCLARPGGQAWRTSGEPAVDEICALLPEEQGVPVPADASRFRLFEGITNLVRAAAGETGLTVVLDDLHWADEPSVRLLVFVARNLHTAPVLLAGTYRDVEVGRDHPLTTAIGELAGVARHVALSGLSSAELGVLVEGTGAGAPAAPELIAALHHRTGGNPFFAQELVRLLQAEGRLTTQPAGRFTVPGSVRAVIDRRLARVSHDCHETLAMAAVIGARFGVDLLGAALGADAPASLADVLDEAAAARLVTDAASGVTPEFAFTHDLVRETLSEGLTPSARAAAHGKVAGAIERLYGYDDSSRIAELAHHLVQAASLGNVAAAIDAATRAGDRALTLMADEEAAGWYRAALDLVRTAPVEPRQHRALLLSLGEARLRTGDLAAARTSYEEAADLARRTGDAEDLARAALGLGAGLGGFEVNMFDRVQIDLLEEALSALPDVDSALRAQVMARLSVALAFVASEDRRLMLTEQAVAMARRIGDRSALGYALAAHCDAIPGPAFTAARRAAAREAVDLGIETKDRRLELLGRRLLLLALLETGDFRGVDHQIEVFARGADALRQPLYRWYVPLWRGMRALMQGQFDEADAWCRQASEIGVQAQSINARMLVGTQDWVRVRMQGRYAEAGSIVDRTFHEVMGDIESALVAAALLRLHEDDIDGARARFEAFKRDGFELPIDAEWLPAMAQLIELALGLADVEGAALLDELIGPYDHLFAVEGIGAAVYGTMGAYRAQLRRLMGDSEEADRLQRDAARAAAAAGLVTDLPLMTPAPGSAPVPIPPSAPDAAVFRPDGELWVLSFRATDAVVKDSKGMHDLRALLAIPGQAVHVSELVVTDTTARAAVSATVDVTLDRKAVAAYRQRLQELEDDLAEAEADHDRGRADKIRTEREFLIAELTGAAGLGGRARRAGDPVERARKAVAGRIKDAIDRITNVHPELGRHLGHAIHTGTFCSYEPEHLVRWRTQ